MKTLSDTIPVDDLGWLIYNNKVFIIKQGNAGKGAKIQMDGTSCKQNTLYGTVVADFKPDSNFFKPQFWYKLKRWFLDENILIFDGIGTMAGYKIFAGKNENKKNDLKQKGVHGSEILSQILQEVKNKTGMKFVFSYPNTKYGQHWFEAYVPVLGQDGKNYVITWQNCD